MLLTLKPKLILGSISFRLVRTRQLLIGHFFTLCLGSFIYLFFRTTDLKMFHWLDTIGFLKQLLEIRQTLSPVKAIIPEWILFALPDGLWMFSYMSLILLVWKNTISRENIVWIFIIPFIAILSEIMQSLKIIPGTSDKLDLTMYLLGMSLPLIFYKKTITINLR